MDATKGIFTTLKLQALLDSGLHETVRNRSQLAREMNARGHSISVHGINAWFRKVESNYAAKRDSLANAYKSYPVPHQRWGALLEVFDLDVDVLDLTDPEFQAHCLDPKFRRKKPGAPIPSKGTALIVGRNEQQVVLRDAISDVTNGESGLIMVEGPPGIGKSFLVSSCCAGISIPVVRAICIEGNDTPLLPIVEGIQGCIPALNSLYPDLGAALLNYVERFLDTSNLTTQGGEASELLQLLLRLAREQPFLLIVDDCHWIDETTRIFVEHFCFRLQSDLDIAALLVTISRSQYNNSNWTRTEQKLGSYLDGRKIALQPLSLEDTKNMLGRLSKYKIAQDVVSAIWSTAGGNPLFSLQLYKHLESEGKFREVNDIRSLSQPIDTMDLPKSVGSFFVGAAERLEDSVLQVLTVAACLGKDFAARDIEGVRPDLTLPLVVEALDEAEQLEIITVRGLLYTFAHPLSRYAVIQKNTSTRIAYTHYLIASGHPSRINNLGLLQRANHMVRGAAYARPSEIAQACIPAMHLAKTLSSWDDILKYFELVSSLPADTLNNNQWAQICHLGADALHKKGRPFDALTQLDQAKNRYEHEGSYAGSITVLNDIVHIRGNFGIRESGDEDGYQNQLKTALANFDEENVALRARIMATLAMQDIYKGKNQAAIERLGGAKQLMGTDSNDSTRAYVGIVSGIAHLNRLEVDAAEADFGLSLKIGERNDDVVTTAQCLQRLSIIALLRGNYANVVELAERAEGYGRATNQTGEVALALAMASTACIAMGEFSNAHALNARGMESALLSRYSWSAPYLITSLACLHCAEERYDKARESLRSLLVKGRFHDNPSRFKRVVEHANLYVDYLDTGQVKKPRFEKFLVKPADFENFDLLRLSRYLMQAKMAQLCGDSEQLELCSNVEREAKQRGIVSSPGWHFELEAAQEGFGLP